MACSESDAAPAAEDFVSSCGNVSTSKGRLSSRSSPHRTAKVQIQHADLKFGIKTGAGLHFMDENVARPCIYDRNAVVFGLENKTASTVNGPIKEKTLEI